MFQVHSFSKSFQTSSTQPAICVQVIRSPFLSLTVLSKIKTNKKNIQFFVEKKNAKKDTQLLCSHVS